MTTDTKIIVGVVVVSVALLIGSAFLLGGKNTSSDKAETKAAKVDTNLLVSEGSFRRGNPNSGVTLVEFADFECPACGAMYPVVHSVVADYEKDIQFVHRNFPLSMHKYARLAAEAFEAAGEQGKAWEMYDLLFKNQATWSGSSSPKEVFIEYAKQLSLDEEQFTQALETSKNNTKINADISDGENAGVNSTPTFFLNGKKLEGSPSRDELVALIKKELKSAPTPKPSSEQAAIKQVLDEYVPTHGGVDKFEIITLKTSGNFAKTILKPIDVVTDNATVFLEKKDGVWTVIWGPGTGIDPSDEAIKNLPKDLLY